MSIERTPTDIIKSAISERLLSRLKHISFNKFMEEMDLTSVYVCGNSCNVAKPNDYDVYLTPEESKDFLSRDFGKLEGDIKLSTRTKNSMTFVYLGKHVIQICNYSKPTLQQLIESFDFSYCQVGAKVKVNDENWLSIREVALTDNYIEYLASGYTEYIGSEYPMSSLIRVVKTNEKGLFNGRSYIRSVLKILTDIMDRGVSDYADFKDQLDAVDLGMAPEDLQGIGDVIKRLFVLLRTANDRNISDFDKTFKDYLNEERNEEDD